MLLSEKTGAQQSTGSKSLILKTKQTASLVFIEEIQPIDLFSSRFKAILNTLKSIPYFKHSTSIQTDQYSKNMSKKTAAFQVKNYISYDKKNNTEVITLPLPKHPITALLLTIYSICMLSMFLFMTTVAIGQFTNIQNIYQFLIAFAVYAFLFLIALFPLLLLYLIFRPKHQERIHLTPTEISIDRGAIALRPTVDINNFIEQAKNSPRKQFSVNANSALRTRLMRYGNRTYLQVLNGAKYENIARGPSNEVREFLFHHIMDYYEKVAASNSEQPPTPG